MIDITDKEYLKAFKVEFAKATGRTLSFMQNFSDLKTLDGVTPAATDFIIAATGREQYHVYISQSYLEDSCAKINNNARTNNLNVHGLLDAGKQPPVISQP